MENLLNQTTEEMIQLFLKFSDARTLSLDDFFRFREEAVRETGLPFSSDGWRQPENEDDRDNAARPQSKEEADLLAAMKAMEG